MLLGWIIPNKTTDFAGFGADHVQKRLRVSLSERRSFNMGWLDLAAVIDNLPVGIDEGLERGHRSREPIYVPLAEEDGSPTYLRLVEAMSLSFAVPQHNRHVGFFDSMPNSVHLWRLSGQRVVQEFDIVSNVVQRRFGPNFPSKTIHSVSHDHSRCGTSPLSLPRVTRHKELGKP